MHRRHPSEARDLLGPWLEPSPQDPSVLALRDDGTFRPSFRLSVFPSFRLSVSPSAAENRPGLGPAVRPQLAQHPLGMVPGGVWADVEASGDGAVGETLGQEHRDLRLRGVMP